MLLQIALGSVVLVTNVLIMAVASLVLESAFRSLHPWLVTPPQRLKLLMMLVCVGLWVLGVITLGVWLWAFVLHQVGAFATLEESVYFALVAFSTLGLGDVVPPHEWRVLSAMAAVLLLGEPATVRLVLASVAIVGGIALTVLRRSA